MEAATAHSRHRGRAHDAGRSGLHLQYPARPAADRNLSPHPQAQLQAHQRPHPAAARKSPRPAGATQDRRAGRRIFPSTPAKDCAPPITCPTIATSYSSFKEHVHQIDMLFPQWLHVNAAGHPDGDEQRQHHSRVPGHRRQHRPRSRRPEQDQERDSGHQGRHGDLPSPEQLQRADRDLGCGRGQPCSPMRTSARSCATSSCASSPRSRPIAAFRSISRTWTTLRYPAYLTFIQELYGDLHPRNLRLYVNVAAGTEDAYLKQIAANSDGVVLMNYDQHEVESEPGPIAAQDWFIANLTRVLKIGSQGKADLRHRQLRLRLDDVDSRSEGSHAIPSRRWSTPRIWITSPRSGSAPPMPMPISISTTTRSIRTSSTSTKTTTSATWCGSSMR